MSMLLLFNLIAGSAALKVLSPSQHDADANLKSCVNSYADQLDEIMHGLGDRIRTHPLQPGRVSQAKVVFNVGFGSTGTHSATSALQMLGLKSWHYVNTPPPCKEFSAKLLFTMGGLAAANGGEPMQGEENSLAGKECPDIAKQIPWKGVEHCLDVLRTFDYNSSFPEHWQAVADAPIAENFINLFLNFPNALFIESARPSMNWTLRRSRKLSFLPLQEPCGMYLPKNIQEMSIQHERYAHMYEATHDFMKCVIPKRKFFPFNFWTDSADTFMQNLENFISQENHFMVTKRFTLNQLSPALRLRLLDLGPNDDDEDMYMDQMLIDELENWSDVGNLIKKLVMNGYELLIDESKLATE